MRNNPRQVVVDGTSMVAVPVKEFESLLATRRQLGSQTARMRMLRDTLVDVSEFLDTLVEALDDDAPPGARELPPASGPAPAGLALVTEIRRRAHQVRALTGAERAGRGPRTQGGPGRTPAA
ncbi:hypothetical protein RB200_39720 [Streptomyces sp. PmtG]